MYTLRQCRKKGKVNDQDSSCTFNFMLLLPLLLRGDVLYASNIQGLNIGWNNDDTFFDKRQEENSNILLFSSCVLGYNSSVYITKTSLPFIRD